jgi:hypothetical protein
VREVPGHRTQADDAFIIIRPHDTHIANEGGVMSRQARNKKNHSSQHFVVFPHEVIDSKCFKSIHADADLITKIINYGLEVLREVK